MQSSQIVNTQTKHAPSPLRNGADTRHRQVDPDEVDQSTEQAFDVLLSAVSQSQTRFKSVQNIHAGEVMFEAPSEKNATNINQRPENSGLSSNELRQDARLDRTSLDSRIADVGTKSQDNQASNTSPRDTTSSDFAERSLNSQGRISAERFSATTERNFQDDQASRHGAESSNKKSVINEPAANELPRIRQSSVAAPTFVAKTSSVAPSPTSNAAQQVAKMLATGQSQASPNNRLAAGPGTAPLARETTNARQAKSATTDRPANYEDVARTVNTRRPGAAAFEQLVQSIQMRSIGGRSSANLQLNPPELGRIVVNVEMDGDDVRINVHTETSEARDLVSDRVTHLREALEGVGIHVDRFQVDADINATPDHQVDSQDSQDARTHDEKPNTADRDSTFSRKSGGIFNTRKVDVTEATREIRSIESVAGIIDYRI